MRTERPVVGPGCGRCCGLHFLGGFLAAPVVVSLAVTGMLFAWNLLIYLAVERLIRAMRSVTEATG